MCIPVWEKSMHWSLLACLKYAKGLQRPWKRTKVIFHLCKLISINPINFYILLFLAIMNTELCQTYTMNLIQKDLAASHSIIHSNMLNPKKGSFCDAVVQITKINWNLTELDKWAHYWGFSSLIFWGDSWTKDLYFTWY